MKEYEIGRLGGSIKLGNWGLKVLFGVKFNFGFWFYYMLVVRVFRFIFLFF